MNRLRSLLADRKRAQRGSVLSGVLIMTMFIAIIAGALMTELSTNFLLSRALVNRVGNQATVNSAVEMALDQLQNTALTNGCPGAIPATPPPPPVTLNGRTAAVSYASCWPTVDARSPQFTPIAAAASFSVDGTHSVIPTAGQDLYVVGDPGGNVYSYQFGQSIPIWSMNLQSSITGPPMAMQDAACQGNGTCPDPQDISYLVPIAGGGGSGCTAGFCVELLGQDVPNSPDVFCYMPASARVTSRPAAGVAFPQIAYFGDSGGILHANSATEYSCAQQAFQTTPGSAAIVAGPVVLKNGAKDEIYVVTSNGSTAQLLRYEYQQSPVSLSLIDTINLPFSNPRGVATENTGGAPRIAITFASGGVAIYNTNSNFDPSLAASKGLGAGITDAPYWCSCPAGPQVGVAGQNGTVYVLDAALNLVGSFAGGSPISTTPASDGVGEWFFGAADGYLYELQQTPGALALVARYGGLGAVGSSVQVSGCPAGICIYLGSTSNAYLVSLDARDATLTACLSNSPPACSGDNPRLWAQVEVGAAGSPRTVHVQGWSYYSP